MHWGAYLSEHRSRFLNELLDLLRIPSISALPEHMADVVKAGEWTAARLRAAGMENVAVMPTRGHPMVYADWLHAPGQPTIMIYGHFDVQPADPLHLWTRPPFEPYIENDRVYARGANDDKGNVIAPIMAVEAMLKTTGKLPVNVKFLIEGQEEIGSPQMPEFVAANKELLACDYIFSADGAQYAEDQPMLFVAKKGLCALQIDIQGAKTDLHSGGFGGAIQNPAHALVEILASMHGPDGKIRVEGFYDTIRPVSDEDRALLGEIPFDLEQYKAQLGIPDVFGEEGYSTIERIGMRPTLEINGVWSGFQGNGVKTVLPNQAHAKISCRIVPDQDPAEIVDLIAKHVQKVAPKGVTVTVTRLQGGAKPFLVPKNHPGNQAAHAVLEQVYGKAPYYTRTGGTIPACDTFLQNLGAHLIGFSFGLPDEGAHAPDEFYRLSSWDKAQRAYCMLLEHLAK